MRGCPYSHDARVCFPKPCHQFQSGECQRGDDCPLIQDDLLAVCAMAALWHYHRYHCIADFDTGRHVVADLVDDPCRIHTGYVGRWIDFLLLGSGPIARHRICWVDRRCMDAEPTHGPLWCQVSKALENSKLSTLQVLKKVAALLES